MKAPNANDPGDYILHSDYTTEIKNWERKYCAAKLSWDNERDRVKQLYTAIKHHKYMITGGKEDNIDMDGFNLEVCRTLWKVLLNE